MHNTPGSSTATIKTIRGKREENKMREGQDRHNLMTACQAQTRSEPTEVLIRTKLFKAIKQ